MYSLTTFITGTMGSGKSQLLISELETEERNFAAFVGKISDSVEEGYITSRNGKEIPAKILGMNARQSQVLTAVTYHIYTKDIDVIYIDEVQFISKATIDWIIRICDRKGIELRLYGLSKRFDNHYFESPEYLINNLPKSNVVDLFMFCEYADCDNKAEYNARIINGKVAREGLPFVEEKSTYSSLCKEHYF